MGAKKDFRITVEQSDAQRDARLRPCWLRWVFLFRADGREVDAQLLEDKPNYFDTSTEIEVGDLG